jgi:hypothetical protein
MAHKNIGRKHSQESKDKMSAAKMGIRPNEETRKKLSLAKKGKKQTPEHIANMRATKIGKPHSKEHTEKVAATHRGKKRTPETRERMSKAAKGKKKNLTIEQRMALIERQRGCKSHFWKGGESFKPYCEKFTKEFKNRVRAFFEYRCICCGKHVNECKQNLHVHHVDYDKMICCNDKPAVFAAMCGKHHSTTNHDRDRWIPIIHRIVDEIYGGKSYYTKEEFILLTKTS